MSSNLVYEPSSANAPLLVPEQRWFAYHYIKLGRWTYFGWWTPQFQSRDAMITSTQILANKPTLADGTPWYQSRDALNTSTQYFADELTLPNGPPKVTGQRCLHTANDIYWSRMAISHSYWQLVVKNCNFTLLLRSSGQEWQFHIATDI